MHDEDGNSGKSAAQILAEVVARRKAATAEAASNPFKGRRQAERAAAARSASKSKPALRK